MAISFFFNSVNAMRFRTRGLLSSVPILTNIKCQPGFAFLSLKRPEVSPAARDQHEFRRIIPNDLPSLWRQSTPRAKKKKVKVKESETWTDNVQTGIGGRRGVGQKRLRRTEQASEVHCWGSMTGYRTQTMSEMKTKKKKKKSSAKCEKKK